MAKLNLSQAARAVGIHRNTLRRHIAEKSISVEYDENKHPLIDTNELIRVYGELKSSGATGAVHSSAAKGHTGASPDRTENALLHQQIAFLEQQLDAVKEQARKAEVREEEAKQRERELLDVVRTQTRLLSPPEPETTPKKGFWKRLMGS